MKILPNIPGLDEAEARAQGRLSDKQEAAIQKILAEPTMAALVGSEVGAGKTVITTEVAVRAGWKRALFIGITHTFDQWADSLADQSDGAIQLRRLESDKPGQAAHADFLAGKDGFYFATIQWLVAQDFTYVDKADGLGATLYRIVKPAKAAAALKAETAKVHARRSARPTYDVFTPEVVEVDKKGQPKPERERKHLRTFAKMSARKNAGLDAVVFDEAHAVASSKAIGRTTLHGFKGRDGAPMWKIGLSATWSGNSFANAWSVPRWCWPELIPASYWEWYQMWVAEAPTLDEYGRQKYGHGQKPLTHVVGEKEPQGTFVSTLPCYIRDESSVEKPEPVKIYVDPTPEQAAQYEDLERDLLTWAANWQGDEAPILADVPGALHARLKQVALGTIREDEDGSVGFAFDTRSSKLGALGGLTRELGEQPVIVFVAGSKKFVKVVAARMAAAGESVAVWDGDANTKERAKIKAAFMAGEVRYIVATPESMGTGTDGMQKVCSKVVWLASPDGQPVIEDQGVGRVARPGVTTKYGPVMDFRILTRGTLDEKKLSTLLEQGWATRNALRAAA